MPDQASDDTPDFALGVALDKIPDGGVLAGHVGDTPILLTRSGDEVRAFSGKCTHLGAPLADGFVVDGAVRCPWHHACFDLRSGRATVAPAFDPLQRWLVERLAGNVVVSGKEAAGPIPKAPRSDTPRIVIVGGGAAGFAAAFGLRQEGFLGSITMVSDDTRQPYDRTLLTKDYLDGKFGDDHLPIARVNLDKLQVDILTETSVERLDPNRKEVVLRGGRVLTFDKLLLATGSAPVVLDVPGGTLPHVHVLRSVDDCRAILARLTPEARVVVIGSNFIGLEAAASIRSRGNAVTVVTPDDRPLAKKIGPQLSDAIMAVHRGKGVAFRLQSKVTRIEEDSVILADGATLAADVVVVGIGVKPRVDLAKAAGLAVDDGVTVDAKLRTSHPDIYAAGDIAAWPDPHGGTRIRVEHWVVAERQGQVAAANMAGRPVAYDAVPFFWSKHFDFSFRYVGHAATWDSIVVEGDLSRRKAVIRYRQGDRDAAMATVGEDLRALEIERDMERKTVSADR